MKFIFVISVEFIKGYIMSNFKVGDIVRRRQDYVRHGARVEKCLQGFPVRIVDIDCDGDLVFSDEDGGSDWLPYYFELVETIEEEEFKVQSAIDFLISQGYTVSLSKNA